MSDSSEEKLNTYDIDEVRQGLALSGMSGAEAKAFISVALSAAAIRSISGLSSKAGACCIDHLAAVQHVLCSQPVYRCLDNPPNKS